MGRRERELELEMAREEDERLVHAQCLAAVTRAAAEAEIGDATATRSELESII